MNRLTHGAICVVALVYVVLGVAGLGQAQTALVVSYHGGQFSWTAPAPTGTQTPAVAHIIQCGTTRYTVPMPATNMPISAVVPGPGSYDCFIWAVNAEGVPSDLQPHFPAFSTSYPPPTPAAMTIVVQ